MIIPRGWISDTAIADLQDLWDRCHKFNMPFEVDANAEICRIVDGRLEPLN